MSGIAMATQSIQDWSAQPEQALGTMMDLSDGRRYRYVHVNNAGGTVEPGRIYSGLSHVPELEVGGNGVPLATAVMVGSTVLPLQLSTLAQPLTANEFAGGLISSIALGPPFAACSIDSHAAAAQNTILSVQLSASDPVPVNLPAGHAMRLAYSPYYGIRQPQTATLSAIIGVAVVPIPANQYGWVQTRGLAPVFFVGDPLVGLVVYPYLTNPGAVTNYANAPVGSRPVGTVVSLASLSQVVIVNLCID